MNSTATLTIKERDAFIESLDSFADALRDYNTRALELSNILCGKFKRVHEYPLIEREVVRLIEAFVTDHQTVSPDSLKVMTAIYTYKSEVRNDG